MTQEEQKEYILDYIQGWVGSKQDAHKWYEAEVIPALNKTAKQAVIEGEFEVVKKHLNQIDEGGFA